MQVATETQGTSEATTPTPPEGKPIPRVRERPIIGSTIDFQKDQVNWVLRHFDEYGDVFKARIVTMDWTFVKDPAIIYQITVGQWEKFYKPKLAKTMWKDFLGNGLVPNDGEDWKRQHKLILPGFHRKRIDVYGTDMVRYTQLMLKDWQKGGERDIRKDMNALTLAIVARTLLAVDVSDQISETVTKSMYDVCTALVEHVNLPLPTPRWWPTKRNRRKWEAIEALEAIIRQLVEDRRATGTDKGDLLSILVQAQDEKGTMTDKQLRDEAMTLLFAGHETTAHALTWMWWLLANNPEAYRKLQEEVAEVVGDRDITVEDTNKMPYLQGVVKESIRMMPSVWAFMREPVEDVVIGGYLFKKGDPIFISPLALGRDARWHPEPEKFKPERWTREYEKGLPRGAYVPFAAGPRVCMGKTFATMEMLLIMGTIAQNVDITVREGFEPDIVPELSMHPGDRGIPATPKFRENAPVDRIDLG